MQHDELFLATTDQLEDGYSITFLDDDRRIAQHIIDGDETDICAVYAEHSHYVAHS